jgi:hypothetical protein
VFRDEGHQSTINSTIHTIFLLIGGFTLDKLLRAILFEN